MKVDVSKILKDYTGEPVKDQNGNPLTLKDVIGVALNNIGANDNPTPEEKAKMFELSVKLYSNNVIEVDAPDITLMNQQVAKLYNPLVMGRVMEALNQK